MRNAIRANFWTQLLWVLVCLLPLIVLFFLPGGALVGGGLSFWLVLLFCFWLIWMVLAPSPATSQPVEPDLNMLPPQEQPEAVKEVMNVRLATEQGGVQVFRGRLRESPTTAYQKLRQSFSGRFVPFMQEDPQFESAIALMPKRVEEAAMERRVFPWINWLLFALTVATTTWAGAAHQGINLLQEPERFTAGLPYALGLLTILGVHELGHFFTARWHGIHVTPPYFIPVPFALGTFGAFIQMKSPTENRRALFDVAVAGPLAGLVIAVPALLMGLESSHVIEGNVVRSEELGTIQVFGGTSAGSSLLFALLAKLALPEALRHGYVLQLSPLAFAGWLGLFITALNLLPIGQLDGGHIARGMFGTRIGGAISSIAMWSLILLAIFVWPGLLMWAILVFFIAGRPVPPLNDLTPLTTGRQWLGYTAFLILALILVPLPHAFWPKAGIYCPYL